MNFFTALSLFAGAIYFYIGGFVLLADRKSAANRFFAALCLAFSLWAFANGRLISAADVHGAWFWHRLAAAAFTVSPAVLFSFVLALTNNAWVRRRPWAHALVYVPGLVYLHRVHTDSLLAQGFLRASFGWTEIPAAPSLWNVTFDLYYLSYSIAALAMVYRWGRRSDQPKQKKQAKIIINSGLVTLGLIVAVDRILPQMAVPALPNLAQIFILIYIFAIWYAITKYRLMRLTAAVAAEDILETMADGLLLLNEENKIVVANRAAKELLAGGGELVGRGIEEVFRGEDFFDRQGLRRRLADNHPVRSHELTYHGRPGPVIPLSVSASLVTPSEGSVGVVVILRDVSERKRVEEELRFVASHDPLTRLPNRLLLHDRLSQALAGARRGEKAVGVLLVDLDQFKTVNDSLGHRAGDELLKAVAARLLAQIRESDTAARMGGDEFVAVVGELDSPEGADIAARRLAACFERPFQVEGEQLHLSASVGASVFPADGETIEELLKHADLALYRAKQGGGNRVELYRSGMGLTEKRRLRLEWELRHALEAQEFEVYYQPIYEVESGTLAGIEALLRWNHPELGMVGPLEFIPAAERNGLIIPIGEWLMERALEQRRRWHRGGLPLVPMSVNVSARQFEEPGFADAVHRLLAAAGLEGRFLELEITESTAMRKLDRASQVMAQLREREVSIVVDDFGAGHNSLSWLKNLPLDGIKIDRFLVQDVVGDANTAAIVKGIATIAAGLGLAVIAEGVESRSQLGFLRSLARSIPGAGGRIRAQGFLLGRPVPAGDFTWHWRLLPEAAGNPGRS